MGTRSIIAAEFDTDNGVEVKGVYAHWDGYPEHMLVALKEIVARDGRDAAVEELFREGGQGWSSIRPSQDADNTTSHRPGDRFRTVLGYGERYLDSPEVDFMTPDDAEEFFYIIRKDGVVVWTEGPGNSGPWYAEVIEADGNGNYLAPGAANSYADPVALDVDEDTETQIVEAVRGILAEAGIPETKLSVTAAKVFAKLSAPGQLGTVI